VTAPLLNRENRAMNALALRRLEPAAGDRVLEVGFGGGALMGDLLAGPAASVAGVDPSLDMLAMARRRFRREIDAGRAEVREGTVEALPFPDASFTKLCTVNTLYFWRDVPLGLAECRRVLAPGGALVLCFAARESMERWPGHVHGFTLYDASDVERRLRDAGFADVSSVEEEDGRAGRFHAVRGVVA
jgi:ubiquinone/menaquinone biosynthesis C-methylase UbiE